MKYRQWAPYLFISPFYVMFAVFMLYPVVCSFVLSFHSWNGVGPLVRVGLANFARLSQDPLFLQSFANSAIIFLMYVPAMTFMALVLAAILNTGYLKFRAGWRLSIFLPYVTAVVAVGYTFALLLDRDYGLLNLVAVNLGLGKIEWLLQPNLARLSLSGLVTWRWLGYNMIIMLGGLQNISPELYEAARIDGAGASRAFFAITVPLMRPVILFAVILSTIGTFSLFTEPYILFQGTGGAGPANSTLTPVLYLYQNAFNFLKFGYASAIAYAYFAVLFILTGLQWRVFGTDEEGRR
ncbi:sugar ABC transporter permease [Carboxydochorda subterranea]|uniref:Sugar ABC transporter permease n=1 Tax=Carboxydichorda subterranea TaxID=3109565 RepID=A0ABZ1BU06_9FIRM|nr:sugar ABC transporter permease [Limnochorda sp. L945t]WRP16286.1 sugar ABC transporter permease [Limnochorda sp. L945t]